MAKDTYIPRDEVVAMNKEFNKVRKKAEEELMRFPGVVSVGVGLKEVKGIMHRELCFKVTVEKKKDNSDLRLADRIPDEIYGFKTDINEIPFLNSSIDTNNYRPLIGGSQLEVNSMSGSGTLGCFATRDSDGKIMVLSNWHVIVGNPDAIDGDRIGQPTHNGCCSCCACNEIGDTTDGRFRTDNLDAAVALLKGQSADAIPDERYLNSIIDIGSIAGSETPLAGETVWKRGRTTGFTKGQITLDNTVANTAYRSYAGLIINRTGQFEITPSLPFIDYLLPGDSGSVSVNEHNQVVLLNYAVGDVTKKGYACNIKTVESVLGISIINSSFHASIAGKEGVLLSSNIDSPKRFNLNHDFEELEKELIQFSEGKRMLELFKTHRSELLNLVNHKREVMAAWNRYQGPSYLAHIVRSVRRDNKPVPEQIKGITLQSLLLKMTAVLQRNGSHGLAQAVTDNYLQVMNILSSGPNPEDWKKHLAQLDERIHSKI